MMMDQQGGRMNLTNADHIKRTSADDVVERHIVIIIFRFVLIKYLRGVVCRLVLEWTSERNICTYDEYIATPHAL